MIVKVKLTHQLHSFFHSLYTFIGKKRYRQDQTLCYCLYEIFILRDVRKEIWYYILFAVSVIFLLHNDIIFLCFYMNSSKYSSVFQLFLSNDSSLFNYLLVSLVFTMLQHKILVMAPNL